MRKRLFEAQKDAMKAKDTARLSTLRLINAAIKDKDIKVRDEENHDGVSDTEIVNILSKMIKQRQDSSKTYEEAGRIELAEQELAEIKVIEEFLPKQLNDQEIDDAISGAIEEIGASSIRDMGKVMGVMKQKYSGQMDFVKVGGKIKDILMK